MDNYDDLQVKILLENEKQRQEEEISLIASENYMPAYMLSLVGSVLTNKYAEGLPGKRYYAGCSVVDSIESLAIERCKKLFGADHVNVQPHAGSQANMAVYMACLKPGDLLMGMNLLAGGHLTHGYNANYSGGLYRVISYGVSPETECIDYDEVHRLADQHKPKLIIAGASAYSRIIDFAKFAEIARSVGAYFMADIAHIAGLVAVGLHQSPLCCADFVTSTTHKTLRGPRGAFIMCTHDYASIIDKTVMPGIQGGPFMHVIAAKAACFAQALLPCFYSYQQQILNNAKTMAQEFNQLGYRLVSGGTDNHLIIIDLTSKGLTGQQAEQILEKAGLVVSRSCIPFDTKKPMIGSGIRLGSSAITTRGFEESQVREIVCMMHAVMSQPDNHTLLCAIKERVKALCKDFPIYSSYTL